jgi:hypothetical protein
MTGSSDASQQILSETNLLCGNNAEYILRLIKSQNIVPNLIAVQLFPATTVGQGALDGSEVFQVNRQVSKPISYRE